MQLVETIQEILAAGVLPLALERQIHQLLKKQTFSETEVAAVDQLIEALCNGLVRSVA